MRKTTIALSIAFLIATNAHASTNSSVDLSTTIQKANYALGVDLAKTFISQGVEIDTQALIAGMQDVIDNNEIKLSVEEMRQAVNDVKDMVLEKQLKEIKIIADKNAKAGEAFLKENKKQDGVITLDSGIQYIVLTEGKGDFATEDDYLVVHYRGTLIDGTEFDSSFARGTPIEFQMSNVIAGWGEILKKMNPGAKWRVFIPPHLAYGEKGAGDKIGPNETLIFEIKLITTNKEKFTP